MLLKALPYSTRFISISRVKIEPLIFKTFFLAIVEELSSPSSHSRAFEMNVHLSSLSLKSMDTEISLISSGIIKCFNRA